MDIKKIQEEIEKYKAWIILAVVLLVITGFGIKLLNSTPDITPYILEKSRLEKELFKEKLVSDSLNKEVVRLEKLYKEESEKQKKIIYVTNSKNDSISKLPLNDAALLFSKWTREPVPVIPGE